jgi:hypothetical protein
MSLCHGDIVASKCNETVNGASAASHVRTVIPSLGLLVDEAVCESFRPNRSSGGQFKWSSRQTHRLPVPTSGGRLHYPRGAGK